MGQAANAFAFQRVDRGSIARLENHFIAPAIYRRNDAPDRQAKLADLVSGEIIPRLLRLHAEVLPEALPVTTVLSELAPSKADISGLADIVLGADLEAAAAYVLMLRDRGLSMDTLFIELLEPAARHLGEMWDRDECDFIDVTLGVGRLQKLLAIFNESYKLPELETQRQVLMAASPGDQHSFGVRMVERFLTAAGWAVQTEVSASVDELADVVQGKWFAVIGLTAGSERQYDTMKALIETLRAQSMNRGVGIMVGGPMFTSDPSLAVQVGADATAPNAPTAVLAAQKLFDIGVAGAQSAARDASRQASTRSASRRAASRTEAIASAI
ncbi:MAG TPA: cobalamin B12-binding domain-containing protein [Sphingomonas sp.]|jgi:methanogenic corrinoid protein MtbC1|nr:cobalamin B12-binding domain-containing protein [Sphingomonas sp.]